MDERSLGVNGSSIGSSISHCRAFQRVEERRASMPPPSQYRERDYEFANTFVALRTTIGLTQAGLARHLGVSSRAVENWEQGLTSPKAEHFKMFLTLCARSSAFAAGHEEEQIRVLWRSARLKGLLDERWLSQLLKQSSTSGGGVQGGTAASE